MSPEARADPRSPRAPAPRRRAAARAAWPALAAGAWIGVLDTAALLARPEAGPLADRIGTLAAALAVDGGVAVVIGAAVGALLARPRRSWARRAAVLAAAAVVGGLGAAALSGHEPEPAGEGASDRTSLILVSIDTLRPDHLDAYGYERETAPNLTALARDGVLFESAYSTSSWTLPAHVSLFTGLGGLAHGVERPTLGLDPRHATLAGALTDAGYWAGAWVGTRAHGYLGASHGLDAGFSLYRHAPHPRRFFATPVAGRLERAVSRRLDRHAGGVREQVDAVRAWLRAGRREPFFLFLHVYDVHSRPDGLPYEAPAPFRERFCPSGAGDLDACREGRCASDLLIAMARRQVELYSPDEVERLRCLYDGGIAWVDHHLGRLFETLDREGLADRVAVVVTSDHGEAFFEHGVPLHMTLHEEILRIPLIVRLPGAAAGKRVAAPVRIVDVMPTLLELAEVGAPPRMEGRSLAAVLRSWVATPEPVRPMATYDDANLAALRDGPFKLIERTTPRGKSHELFDVVRDPAERRDLSRHRPGRLAALRRALADRRARSTALRAELRAGAPVPDVEIPEAQRERLRALGYADDAESR
jgi:arylsulfatase A-like enzyme